MFILYGFLYLLSLLPLRALYLVSDGLYEVVYYVIRYRKKIVMKNLRIAFPGKSEKERIQIAKKFYRNFCDTLIETIKIISVDQAFLQKHFKGDYQMLNDLYLSGRSAQVHLGHNFNWEMENLAVPPMVKYKSLAVYMPLQNKFFNTLMMRIRTRFNTYLIAATNMKEEMKPWSNTQYLLYLAADQKPGDPQNAYWVNFFGKLTPFLRGPEKAAVRNDLPVFFAHVKKNKRGYYQPYFHLAAMHPKELPTGELTKQFASYLEKVMREQPEMWLWSHNRWKWEFNEQEFGELVVK